jgi:hypothetical protein
LVLFFRKELLPVGELPMFAVGQKVFSRDGKRHGVVLECVGDRVYIEQDNGAELDFPAADLTAVAPAAPAARAASGASAEAVAARVLTSRDITPAHLRVLGVIPARTLQAVAGVFERGPGAGRFSALDSAGKLNVIAEITAVPYRTMEVYSDRPGELGLMMGKGLADRARGV